VIEPIRDNWVIALGVVVVLSALLVWWRTRR
jgi:LPXTG-motif cell wall-anchored protein